jgi:hypothetical protein
VDFVHRLGFPKPHSFRNWLCVRPEVVVRRRKQIQLLKHSGFLEHQPMYKVQTQVITPHYFTVFTTKQVISSPGTYWDPYESFPLFSTWVSKRAFLQILLLNISFTNPVSYTFQITRPSHYRCFYHVGIWWGLQTEAPRRIRWITQIISNQTTVKVRVVGVCTTQQRT